jgi:hypothetical protein
MRCAVEPRRSNVDRHYPALRITQRESFCTGRRRSDRSWLGHTARTIGAQGDLQGRQRALMPLVRGGMHGRDRMSAAAFAVRSSKWVNCAVALRALATRLQRETAGGMTTNLIP